MHTSKQARSSSNKVWVCVCVHVCNHRACICARLLDPCYKTGQKEPAYHQQGNTLTRAVTSVHPMAILRVPCSHSRQWLETGWQRGEARCATHSSPTQSKTWWASVLTHCNLPNMPWLPSFPVQQVQAYLSLCSKSCFTFPSSYLFAISFGHVFCFRWTLPTNSCTNPKGHNSE